MRDTHPSTAKPRRSAAIKEWYEYKQGDRQREEERRSGSSLSLRLKSQRQDRTQRTKLAWRQSWIERGDEVGMSGATKLERGDEIGVSTAMNDRRQSEGNVSAK